MLIGASAAREQAMIPRGDAAPRCLFLFHMMVLSVYHSFPPYQKAAISIHRNSGL
jgi:hypothetical protein